MRVLWWWLIWSVISGSFVGAVAEAQNQPASPMPSVTPTPSAETVTQEVLDAFRKQIEETKDLDDPTRMRITDLLRLTGEHLARTNEMTALAADSQMKVASIEERLRARTEELDALRRDSRPQLSMITTLAELETDLIRLEASLAELKARAVEADAEPKRRAARRKDARALLISSPQRLEEVKRQLATPAPAGEIPQLTRARQLELLTRKQVVELEPQTLQAELSQYDAEDAVELARLQRELLALQIAQRTEEVRLRSEQVAAQRREDARLQAVQARQELVNSLPALRPIAERNQVITEKSRDISARNEQATRDLNAVRQLLEGTRKQISQVKEKVRTVGLTGPIGLRLRQQRSLLPDVRALQRNIDGRLETIETAQLEFFEYDDELAALASIDPLVEELVRAAGTGLTEPQEQQIRDAARDLLERQREYLASLVNTYNSYSGTLGEIDDSERQLVTEISSFDHYVDERVLWIRSHLPLSLNQIQEDRPALYHLLETHEWLEAGGDLFHDLRRYPLLYLLAGLIWGLLVYSQRRIRTTLKEIGERVERRSFYRFEPTLHGLVLTILIAADWPVMALFCGWRLQAAGQSDFSRAVGSGLFKVALLTLLLQTVRQLCRPNGIARSHFGWPARATTALRGNLHLLMLPGLPLTMAIAVIHALKQETGSDAIERCLFIAGMMLISAFAWRTMHPLGDTLIQLLNSSGGGWLDRLRYVWFPSIVLGPLVVASLAIAGYYYTALQLASKLHATAWLLTGLMFLNSLLVRWVMVSRRKASIEAARERLAAAAAPVDPESSSSSLPVPAASPELNIQSISEQSRRLINISIVATTLMGLWLLWIDILPALSARDRFPLWNTTVSITERVERGDGTIEYRTVERPDVVTIADLGFALLLILLMVTASRNLPGLMEMSILRRLPLSDSARYAITSLTSYGMLLIGLILSTRTIGLGWQQVQWLAAALTVGLGFGLQEIFANFVSGLIILFEQPVRVGDVVTLDNVTGVVNRIRIRATTITDWDRKEYIVPNRELITGRVLNWTLSDRVNRIVITVRVAFGCDTDRVRQIILQAARDAEFVLPDPPPVVTFDQIGENALNFTLRVYLPNLDNRLETIHWLNTEIHRRLNAAGIAIPFPQRELHIRSLPESLAQTLARKPDV